MRTFAAAIGFLSILSCRGVPEAPPWTPGECTPERVAAAARHAGFDVREIDARIPPAARSRLPYVSIAWDDPRLASLRRKYPIEKAVASAPDSWTAQLLLKEWVHRAIPGGTPRVPVHHAEEILDAAARGEPFWCTYYAITYLECARALGWPCRKVAVDRRHGPEGLGSVHHGIVEVWSDRFAKWAVIDAQSNLHFEMKGVPLSAWEIRAEWLRNGGADVEHITGAPTRAIRKNPAIVWWDRKDEDETAAFFWIYVIDHADVSDRAARLLLPQDRAHAGQTWYQNDKASGNGKLHVGYARGQFVPAERLEDVYWTEGVVEARVIGASAGRIDLALEASGTGLTGFEASFDGGAWVRVEDAARVAWPLHAGRNELRLRTVRLGGTTGPEMAVRLLLEGRSP